jgi:hypothetical protein
MIFLDLVGGGGRTYSCWGECMALLLRLEPAVCSVREAIEGGGETGEYATGGDLAFEAMEELRVLEPLESAAGGRDRESIAARLFGWISEEGTGLGNDGDGLDMTANVRAKVWM